jgi:CheY-like chemotaxis protein
MTDPPKVLIVDDDASIRGLLAEVVRREGRTPVLAASGLEGYASLTALGPKISMVLLDLSMPEMDGFAFRDLQLEDPDLAEIPTVVLTGQALTPEQLSFIRPTAVLFKPAPLADIRRVIRQYAQQTTAATHVHTSPS